MPTSPPTFPFEADLRSLPKWARVVFAARCSQRVLPFFDNWDKIYNESKFKDIGQILTQILEAAKAGKSGSETFFQNPAAAADIARKFGSDIPALVADSIRAAGFAATRGTPKASVASATYALTAAKAVFGGEVSKFIHALEEDLQFLRSTSLKLKWTDISPVDYHLLGELWPTGEPQKKILSKPSARVNIAPQESFELYLETGAASSESIARLLAAISKLDIAAGGAGFEYISDEGFIYVREMAFA